MGVMGVMGVIGGDEGNECNLSYVNYRLILFKIITFTGNNWIVTFV
jgi:hypothetical protein